MTEKQYLTVLGALAEKLSEKNIEIMVLKHQVDGLKKALENAQKTEATERGATA